MRRTMMSFGQLAMRLSGVTASDIIRERIAQSPGGGPRGGGGAGGASGAGPACRRRRGAGGRAPGGTGARRGERFRDGAVQGVMPRFRLPRPVSVAPAELVTPRASHQGAHDAEAG